MTRRSGQNKHRKAGRRSPRPAGVGRRARKQGRHKPAHRVPPSAKRVAEPVPGIPPFDRPTYEWTVHERQGTVSILGPRRFPVLEKFWVDIELEDGDVLSTCQAGFKPGPHGWRSELANGRIVVDLTLRRCAHPAGVLIDVAVRNRGEASVTLRAVRPVRATFGASYARWSPFAAWRILRMGYCFGGAHREDPDARNSTLVTFAPERVSTRSWGVVAVKFSETSGGLVLGFLTSRRQMTWFDLNKDLDEVDVAAVCDTDGTVLEPGGVLKTETLYLGLHADVVQGLSAYAALSARQMKVRLKPAPVGWCSWYFYRKQDVSEEVLLDQARFLAERRDALPLQVVQLDDGYHQAYGDWLDTNARFPHGLEWLAGQVAALGFQPGLWLAPFVAQASSKLFRAHPGWMVQDGSGNPLPWEVEWAEPHEPWYALDGSHPEVQQWLTKLFADLKRFGYTYFKLDFLFMGCLRAFHLRPVTRVEAYRQGLEAIRRGAGDAYLLGCTAPYPPSVGLVDGMRVSHDIHAGRDPWRDFSEAMRETHQRCWAHGRLWNADHDAIVVRELEGVSGETSRALASSVWLSGGALFAGDSLPALPLDRLDLLARTLKAAQPQAAVPVDLFMREHPRVLSLPLGRGRYKVAVFNFTDVSRAMKLDLSLLGLRHAAVMRLEDDRVEPLGRMHRQFLTPPIPARGVVLLLIEGL